MVEYKKAILIIAIILRLGGQMQQVSDNVYFYTRDFFDMAVLFILTGYCTGFIKHIMYFILGLAVWNFIEPCFFDPTLSEPKEYIYFVIGFIFMIFEYVFESYYKAGKRIGKRH